MNAKHQNSWIETLTEIVSDFERLDRDREREVRKLAEAFFIESIEICRIIRESYQLEEGTDEEDFANMLMQCSEDIGVTISSFDRSPAFQKDEMCYCMYRFISLLSQRINFESSHKPG